MKPDMQFVIKKLLQENADMRIANYQMQSIIDQYENQKKGELNESINQS